MVNLNLRESKKPSSVSHHAVRFGAVLTNNSRTKSSICKSTANVGSDGAHGKSPLDKSCKAGSVQVHKIIVSISTKKVSVIKY